MAVLIVFQIIASTVNHQVETYFKYKVVEIRQALWTRMNERLGVCMSLVNATIYLFLLTLIVYVLGYPAHQLSSGDQDTRMFQYLVKARVALQETQMDKALAAFDPAPRKFYVVADTVGLIYRNPLLIGRAAQYPPLMVLGLKPEFQDLANDKELNEKFQSQPPIQGLLGEPKVQAILTNAALVQELLKLDFKDFTNYLVTGQTEKYNERILGHWSFDLRSTLAQARRAKPNMTPLETLRLRLSYTTNVSKANIIGYLDNQLVLKVTGTNNITQTYKGTWRSSGGSSYQINWASGNFSPEMDVETDRLTFKYGNKVVVFEKEP
jgi:hypothetical protein